jgi:hypothetical protein
MLGQSGKNSKSWETAVRQERTTIHEHGRDGLFSEKRLTGTKLAAIQATGQHHAIPQRPPGMTHLAAPPATPRVARPQREATPPKKIRRRIIILGSIFASAAIIACVLGILLASGMLQSSGPATTFSDFFGAISSNNYEQAYQDLGPAITIQLNQQEFTKQAQDLDQLYGPITDYQEVANSATVQDNSQSYTFTIRRSKLKNSYNLRIALQQDPSGDWKIVDYGTSLGPEVGQ